MSIHIFDFCKSYYSQLVHVDPLCAIRHVGTSCYGSVVTVSLHYLLNNVVTVSLPVFLFE